jgi:hypothetical protein
MNIVQTGKMLMKAKQAQNKLKNVNGVGKSKSGKVAVLLNGIQEFEVKLLVSSPAEFKSNKELEAEIQDAYKNSHKELEKKLQQDVDVDSLKDMLGL